MAAGSRAAYSLACQCVFVQYVTISASLFWATIEVRVLASFKVPAIIAGEESAFSPDNRLFLHGSQPVRHGTGIEPHACADAE
jgi:hypothetical protein